MPTEYYYDNRKYAMQNLESGKKLLNSSQFKNAEKYPDEKKKDLYAWMFAIRMSVNAVRGKKDSLKKGVTAETLKQNYEFLTNNKTFADFVAAQKHERMKKLLSEGHGGTLEDIFKEYVASLDKLPEDLPQRFMPDALTRTRELKKKMLAPGFRNAENRSDVFAKLMGTLDAADALSGDKAKLQQQIDPEELKDAVVKWKNCPTFTEFLNDPDSGAREAALKGEGSALGEKFKEYVKNLDVIPEDVPESMQPDGLSRVKALQNKIKEYDPIFDEPETNKLYFAQLMATRSALDAKRGDTDRLKGKPDAKTVNDEANRLMKSVAFNAFIDKDDGAVRKRALTGNAGALEDGFKYYVTNMNELPADVPKRYMPTGRNVPANATPEQKRLYLAKVLVAYRAMADDKKIDLSAARKSAKKLMENPHLKAATRDLKAVDRVLFAKPKAKPVAEENAPLSVAPAGELRINEDPAISGGGNAPKKKKECPLNPNISAAIKLLRKMDEARNEALSRKLRQTELITENRERPRSLLLDESGDAKTADGDTPEQENPGGYSLGM